MKGHIILLAFLLHSITSISYDATKIVKIIDGKPVIIQKADLDVDIVKKVHEVEYKPKKKRDYYTDSESDDESETYSKDWSESESEEDDDKDWPKYKDDKKDKKKHKKDHKKKKHHKKYEDDDDDEKKHHKKHHDRYYEAYEPVEVKKSLLSVGESY